MTRLAPLGALALLAGCSVGPDYVRPDSPAPEKWASAPEAEAAEAADLARWWTSLGDPVLDGLIDRALAANLDVREAEARLLEARALWGVEASGFLPAIGADGSYSRVRRSRTSQSVSSSVLSGDFFRPSGGNLFQGGFDASWEIDVFGGTRRAVEAAEADVAAAEEARRDALVSVAAEVARNYAELRGLQRRAAIARENVRIQRDTADLARARFQAGLTSDLQVAQAEGQLASTEAQVPALDGEARRAIHRLGVLLGETPEALLAELSEAAPIPEGPAFVPPGLPSDLLRRRPDVRRAERELAAATARVGVATADLFPRFSLTGAVGRESRQFNELRLGASTFWSVGPTVSWSIFEGGRVLATIDAADAREAQAIARYRKAVLASLEDVESALAAHASERERRQALERSAEANRRAVALANELYAKGLTDFLNVLESQRSLVAVEDALAQSERSVLVNLVALYKALGGGWSEAAEDGEESGA